VLAISTVSDRSPGFAVVTSVKFLLIAVGNDDLIVQFVKCFSEASTDAGPASGDQMVLLVILMAEFS
jgi:hypothetical protein